jgi:hypothetical protein
MLQKGNLQGGFMRSELKIASAALAGLLMLGCDSKSDTSSAPAAPAAPSAQPSANSVTDAAKDVATGVQNATVGAKDQVAGAMSSAVDTAKSKLAEVEDYIKNNKLDAADTALKEVEKIKSSLPQALQDQVTSLRSKLDAAKAH